MKDTTHTVKAFGDELDNLISSMKEMKDMVTELILLSEQSVVEYKEDLFPTAIAKDKKINQLEDKISEYAMSVLALRQPMAIDLRFTVSSIKIASLLERIGDRSKKTVKKTNRITKPFSKEILEDIHNMNKIIIDMVDDVFSNIEQYKFNNLKKAYDNDDAVDEYYSNTMKKIIASQEKTPDELEEFIAKIKIVKNFERIGDFATKIAKILLYVAEGSNSKASL